VKLADEDSIRPRLVAAAILLILLAAVAAWAGPGGMAAAVPHDTLALVELGRPLEQLDTLRSSWIWGPVTDSLSARLPANRLASYDAAIAVEPLAAAASAVVAQALPEEASRIGAFTEEFERATGLDLGRDLIPLLGPRVALALLPPQPGQGWPRAPRPVMLVETGDSAGVERVLERGLRWLAGCFAVASQGAVSASFEPTDAHGVRLLTLEVQGELEAPR